MRDVFRRLSHTSSKTRADISTDGYGKVREDLVKCLGAAGLFLFAAPAHADNECGAAVGSPPTATCSDTSPTAYPSGINYSTTTGIDLNVSSGVVLKPPPNYDSNGIHVSSSAGNALLRVTVANGVVIRTEGDASDGVAVHADSGSNSDIEIVSGADITTNGDDASALLGWILDSNSPGNISIARTQGGAHHVEGAGSGGIYGLNQGLGSVQAEAGGDIFTKGDIGHGVMAYVNNPNATGDAKITLTSTGGCSPAAAETWAFTR